jgi:hypothetical protein
MQLVKRLRIFVPPRTFPVEHLTHALAARPSRHRASEQLLTADLVLAQGGGTAIHRTPSFRHQTGGCLDFRSILMPDLRVFKR